MKSTVVFGLFLMGTLMVSNNLFAQEVGVNQLVTGDKEQLIENKNLEFQTHFFEALKQKAINNYSKAIESLEACYAIDSTSKAVEFEFSKNYLLLKKYIEAEIFIDKALLQDPKNVYLLTQKVAIYKAQRSFNLAIEIQKEIITMHPSYSDELVLLYLQNQNFEKAEVLIAEIEAKALATSKIKGYKQYIANRKKAMESATSKPKMAAKTNDIATLKKQYETSKDFKLLRQILNSELQSNNFNALYSDSKEGLELFPTQPFLYQINGLALNKLMKYNEAIAVLSIGIDFVIDNNQMEADFYEQLSIAYKGLENESEALKYKQKAEKLRQNK
ncbi:tetratricopeptide repeat protein [Lutibacter holmesii]|uniref:Tetratricopeptide repeat protein n=1 Tax=Lutibacter holmesii TaxID=1137985 RepID=A0ABW3WKN3_9FLAO